MDRFYLKQLVSLVQVLLHLLLVTDVLPDLFLVQSDGADTIPAGPEFPTEQRAFGPQHFPVDPDRAFALQVSHRHRDALLGRNAEQHVDVIRHRFVFDQLHVSLPAQFQKDFADRVISLQAARQNYYVRIPSLFVGAGAKK